MPKHLMMYIVVAANLFGSAVVYAQQDQSPRLYMALLDYDAFHIQLIDRCANNFPETVPALQASIGQWGKRNRAALEELRLLIRDKTVREGMTEKEADARFAQSGRNVSQFMAKGLATMPVSQLEPTCGGSYSEQLGSSDMDYVEFLEQLKSELKK